MKTLFENAVVLTGGKLIKKDFYVEDGKFRFERTRALTREDYDKNSSGALGEHENKDVSACGRPGFHTSPHGKTFDLSGYIVLPAIIDVHTHGAAGYDFNTADAGGMDVIINHYRLNGVGSALATVMTDSRENLLRRLSLIADFAKNRPDLKGIHLEGPFLARAYKGAMNEKFLLPPDRGFFDEMQQAAGGLVKIVTISPELPGAAEFTKHAVSGGVVVSLGHSGATYAQAMACVDAGAKSFTHTFNAMAPLDHHRPSVALAALLADCYAEAICDGKHLAPEFIRLLLKAKTNGRLVCVTDSTMAAGLNDGEYSLSGLPVSVKNGEVFLTGTATRAGSALSAFDGIKNYMAFTGKSLPDAMPPFTLTPAKLLGLDKTLGSIDEGKQADFIAVKEGKVAATFINGEKVFGVL